MFKVGDKVIIDNLADNPYNPVGIMSLMRKAFENRTILTVQAITGKNNELCILSDTYNYHASMLQHYDEQNENFRNLLLQSTT